MQITRRGFLGSILAAGAAPVIVRAASLMPIVPAKIIVPIVDVFYEGQAYRCTGVHVVSQLDPLAIKRYSLQMFQHIQRESALLRALKE